MELQMHEQDARIDRTRYNTNYNRIKTWTTPRYLLQNKKKVNVKIIAIFRCGNEEGANQFWKTEEERSCRLCGRELEILTHLRKNCREMNREDREEEVLMVDDGSGLSWMMEVLKNRKNIGNYVG